MPAALGGHGLLTQPQPDWAALVVSFAASHSLRHDDIGPNAEVMFVAGAIDRVGQPSAGAVVSQERLSPEGGEGQGAGVAC